MAIEGGHLSDYDPLLRPKFAAEAARVIRSFSFAGAHVVVVGGLVPSLLIPRPEPGLEPHVGTNDLDLCLSVALVDGAVGNYDRLETCLRDAGFVMAREGDHTVSWRWRGGSGMPLTVEFFCAAGPGRDPGRLFRPGGVVGGKLSAMAIAAGRLVDRDARDVEIDVELPDNGGKTVQRLKVAGPSAYLASKADALRRRTKNKDAYDIVWLCECWPGGQSALAAEIAQSPVASDPDFVEALRVLSEEFGEIDCAGAVRYGRFMASDVAGADIHARRAVGAVTDFLTEVNNRSSQR